MKPCAKHAEQARLAPVVSISLWVIELPRPSIKEDHGHNHGNSKDSVRGKRGNIPIVGVTHHRLACRILIKIPSSEKRSVKEWSKHVLCGDGEQGKLAIQSRVPDSWLSPWIEVEPSLMKDGVEGLL